jgi:hypothetical protein
VTFALNHVKADYNAEAREAAESYLDSGHLSHNSLMDQLTSEYGEQFTKAQAAQPLKAWGSESSGQGGSRLSEGPAYRQQPAASARSPAR